MRQTYRMSNDDKVHLKYSLEKAGFAVEIAMGEADVHIARKQGNFAVMSTDSDMIFHHNVKTWWIPNLKGQTLCCRIVLKESVLKATNLTAEALLVLAIVSGNDYSSNIPSYGINTNAALLADMKGKGNISKYMSQYVKEVALDDSLHFSKALKIFRDLSEIILDESSDQSITHDNLVQEYEQVRSAYQTHCFDDQSISTNLVHRFHSTNPFRPLESIGSSKRFTFHTVDLMKQSTSDIPPLPKPTPKRIQKLHTDKSVVIPEPTKPDKTKETPKKAGHVVATRKSRVAPDAKEKGPSQTSQIVESQTHNQDMDCWMFEVKIAIIKSSSEGSNCFGHFETGGG